MRPTAASPVGAISCRGSARAMLPATTITTTSPMSVAKKMAPPFNIRRPRELPGLRKRTPAAGTAIAVIYVPQSRVAAVSNHKD